MRTDASLWAGVAVYFFVIAIIYLVMGGEQQSLEGEHAPARTVVSHWPDRAAALAFWHSPEYTAIKPLRAGTGTFRVLLADGARIQILNDTATEGNAA